MPFGNKILNIVNVIVKSVNKIIANLLIIPETTKFVVLFFIAYFSHLVDDNVLYIDILMIMMLVPIIFCNFALGKTSFGFFFSDFRTRN